MTKLFALSFISGIFALTVGATADAATMWWQQSTICRINPTDCYTGMGTGFDNGMWDATSNCWGLKLICPQATVAQNSDPVPMGKTEIVSGTGIKPDFDTSALNGDCFGARKTNSNGSQASVNGKYVNVWCNGILDNVDEVLASGEITFATQPTCSDLAPNGWVGVLNQRCYGKFYDPSKYYIECNAGDILPSRLIVLNGAEPLTGTGSAPGLDYPTDLSAAQALLDSMQATSAQQKDKYFNKK